MFLFEGTSINKKQIKQCKNNGSKLSPLLSKVAVVHNIEQNQKFTQEEMVEYSKENHINIQNAPIHCIKSYSELVRGEVELAIISKILDKYSAPTPIQRSAIHYILKNRDTLCIAPTGSGKTLVYVLGGILQLVRNNSILSDTTKMLIVVPTKELMIQIKSYIQQHFDVSVGMIDKLHKYKQAILVSTPLLLVRAIDNNQVTLDLDVFIMDEADKLLNKQFISDIQHIHKNLKAKQVIMTSATFPHDLEVIAKMMMHDSIRITVGNRGANRNITQKMIYCGNAQGKLLQMKNMILDGIKPPILIFVNDVDSGRKLYRELENKIMKLGILHAYLTPQQRKQVMSKFIAGDIWVLISSDVLSRGIDINIEMVINYDAPVDNKTYIHRIGRTGRQREGHAVTFYTNADIDNIKKIVNVMKETGMEVPEHLLHVQHKKRKYK
eukprot:NODE_610_length_6054_cov_0.409908.p3 type:complete len:438 gc:universal NODE_610_length_6054_cov_0.409908:267-1580(+)